MQKINDPSTICVIVKDALRNFISLYFSTQIKLLANALPGDDKMQIGGVLASTHWTASAAAHPLLIYGILIPLELIDI